MTTMTQFRELLTRRAELHGEWADLEYPTTTHPNHTPRDAAAAMRIAEIRKELSKLGHEPGDL